MFNLDYKDFKYSRKNAYMLAQASALVYLDWPEVEKQIKAWGFTLKVFDNKDSQAFLIQNADYAVLSFRGTQTLKDWLYNLDVSFTDSSIGKVHEGFSNALDAIWEPILEAIKEIPSTTPLFVTGHSLGAAMGTHAAIRLNAENVLLAGVYTFGSPRALSTEAAEIYNSLLGDITHRYVNNNDVVPRVPTRSMGFGHVWKFHYFMEDGNQNDEISWRDKLLDRIHGRLDDLGELGTDGVKDHSMPEEYLLRAKINFC